jgi:hypothetical protein
MNSTHESPLTRRLFLLLPPALAALLLFAGLGSAGPWESRETAVLEAALAGEAAGDTDRGPAPLAGLLASSAVALLGRTEGAARLPGAVLCWLAVLVVHLTLIVLGGRRVAAFGTLAFASSSVGLLHGCQLTGEAPLLLAQTAATAGLALHAFAPGRRTALAGGALAVAGLLAGTLEAGLLVGTVLPAGTVLATLGLTGDVSGFFTARERLAPGRRTATAALAAAAVVLALCGWLAVVLVEVPDVRAVTGGLAAAPAAWPGFDGPLERLAYGWFPWSVATPLLLLSLAARDPEAPADPLPALALAGLGVGYLVQIVDDSLRGPGPAFLALPMAAAVGVALHRLGTSRAPAVLATALVLAFAAVLLRDFAQEPGAILKALGAEGIRVPEDFAPVVGAALASVPFGVMIFLLGLFPGRRGLRNPLLALVAAAVWGGFLALSVIPGLSPGPSNPGGSGARSETRL